LTAALKRRVQDRRASTPRTRASHAVAHHRSPRRSPAPVAPQSVFHNLPLGHLATKSKQCSSRRRRVCNHPPLPAWHAGPGCTARLRYIARWRSAPSQRSHPFRLLECRLTHTHSQAKPACHTLDTLNVLSTFVGHQIPYPRLKKRTFLACRSKVPRIAIPAAVAPHITVPFGPRGRPLTLRRNTQLSWRKCVAPGTSPVPTRHRQCGRPLLPE